MALNISKFKQTTTSVGHSYRYYSSADPSANTTILFVHGFPYTANIWTCQVAFFEKLGYGCVVPDMLGFGGTDKPRTPEHYTARNSAQSLVDILAVEGVDHAVVVGHDWGSVTASRLALFHPSKVLALVQVSIPHSKPSPFNLAAVNDFTEMAMGYAVFGYWEMFLSQPELLREHTDSAFDIIFAKDSSIWKTDFAPRNKLQGWLSAGKRCSVGDYVTDVMRKEFYDNDWLAATQYYHAIAEGFSWESEKDLPEQEHRIKLPSFMIGATDDAVSPVPMVQSSLPNYEDVKFLALEGDHHAFLSNADEFNRQVEIFLGEKGIVASSS